MRELVAGYGSLMSHDSRHRFSGIASAVVPVKVLNWKRGWVTRSESEQQTYVGAVPSQNDFLNACLVDVKGIDEGLKEREKDFAFRLLDHDDIEFYDVGDTLNLTQCKVWICETLEPKTAVVGYPVNQTYLDTCLQGCLEAGHPEFVADFLTSTDHLTDHWVDDRSSPRYPRAARLQPQQDSLIDEHLAAFKLLEHRRT